MLFNTNVFLYVFLPCVLICYFLAGRAGRWRMTGRNAVLLVFSLLFYFYGSGAYVLLLAASIAVNYAAALLVERARWRGGALWLTLAMAYNLGSLVVFKYLGFFAGNISAMAEMFGLGPFELAVEIALPIGISFYTFQAMSYTIDVYAGRVKAERSILRLATYIAFFPALIAGPIVRYETVSSEFERRRSTLEDVYYGASRFCYGLGKKVILANTLGGAVDLIFERPTEELTPILAWTGLLLYTLQIYLDFSAYSDMAIGLARVFGLHLLENFVYPYSSRSVTEFWRRWHISLSSFFRDYVYIPLGGNRRGPARTYLNLWIVFLLCGLWHGASWTFVAWGAYHGALLVVERIAANRKNWRPKGVPGLMATFLLVMVGWLVFRSPDLGYAWGYLRAMFGVGGGADSLFTYWFFMNSRVVTLAAWGLVVAAPWTKLREKLRESPVYGLGAVGSLALAMLYMSDASFSPFIYFQF